MIGKYTEKEKEDARKISLLFLKAPEESKLMAIGYLSALVDKEEADKARKKKELREV